MREKNTTPCIVSYQVTTIDREMNSQVRYQMALKIYGVEMRKFDEILTPSDEILMSYVKL